MKSRVLSFGSLASPLARNQTQNIIDRLQAAQPRLTCQLNILPSPVADADKKGEPFLATSRREIEFLEQMIRGEQARLVVLEAADMVLPLPAGMAVLCVPDRSNPFDAFLNRHGRIMDEMEPGSRIGVLSMRSRVQMSSLWPDLKFEILRGGVDLAMETHMRRNEIDGLVLPAAVTEYLGIQGIVAEIFSPDFILPGPGQGILVVLGRENDQEARDLLDGLHSEASAVELDTEQAFCSRMISDQDLPLGALARVKGSEVVIVGATGSGLNRISVNGPVQEAQAVGAGLATQILACSDSFADLLEADFPDGLPEEDEEGDLLDDFETRTEETDDEPAAIGPHDREDPDDPDESEVLQDLNDLDDLDEKERLRSLEDLAGLHNGETGPKGKRKTGPAHRDD